MKRWIVLATLCSAAAAFAGEYSGGTDMAGRHTQPGDDSGDLKEWLFGDQPPPRPPEQPFTRPELATLKRWAPFTVNYESRANDFYISLDSVEVGADDIIRYAMAVVPKRGNVRNIRYEGIDCKTRQYRVYAYSNAAGDAWQDAGTQDWKRLVKNQRNAYQGELHEVFCSYSRPAKQADILRELWDSKKQPGDCPGCRTSN